VGVQAAAVEVEEPDFVHIRKKTVVVLFVDAARFVVVAERVEHIDVVLLE